MDSLESWLSHLLQAQLGRRATSSSGQEALECAMSLLELSTM